MPKAFSVYRTSVLARDGTVTYDGVDLDTTVGCIDPSSGEFVAPDKGVYRFTFTGNYYCPRRTGIWWCNSEISLMAGDKIIATSHEVNANLDVVDIFLPGVVSTN